MEWNEAALAEARAWLSSHPSSPCQKEFFEKVVITSERPVMLVAPRGSGKTIALLLVTTLAIQSGATVEWLSTSQLLPPNFIENMQQVVGRPLHTIVTQCIGGWCHRISDKDGRGREVGVILVSDGVDFYKKGIMNLEGVMKNYSRVCGAFSDVFFLSTVGDGWWLFCDIISPHLPTK